MGRTQRAFVQSAKPARSTAPQPSRPELGSRQPFPDGTIIARLAWSYESSEENNRSFGREQSFVAGHPKNGVQFMVKDATRYASTGGWLYTQFDDGKPLRDEKQIRSCFVCHQVVKTRDFVFTRYAQ